MSVCGNDDVARELKRYTASVTLQCHLRTQVAPRSSCYFHSDISAPGFNVSMFNAQI
jgi:hypothetical protein